MKKTKLYRYIGVNGILTTHVLLEGIKHIPMYYLKADKYMVLTDGEQYLKTVNILAENINDWKEIPDSQADNEN